jgi:hypothetical protein
VIVVVTGVSLLILDDDDGSGDKKWKIYLYVYKVPKYVSF